MDIAVSEGLVQETPADERPPKARLRLRYLDGLRAIAALNVVATHALFQSRWYGTDGSIDTFAFHLMQWLSQGRSAVAVFIVLSGYCLMLPVARSRSGKLRDGWIHYFYRRARRILPPYYAALLLTLLAIAVLPGLRVGYNPEWNNALPAWTARAISAHLLLLHNLNTNWILKINPPMWTVATEWQIYFLFPLFLLPMWRRFGSSATIATAFGSTLALFWVTHHGEGASPWFLGLFAMGMAGAAFSSEQNQELYSRQHRVPWGALAAGLFAGFALLQCACWFPWLHGITQGKTDWLRPYQWGVDALVGAATVCLIIYCHRANACEEGRRSFVLRLLEWPCLVELGTFSYSLYLIHDPLLAAIGWPLYQWKWTGSATFAALMIAGLPVVIGAAYLFHLCFERRLLNLP